MYCMYAVYFLSKLPDNLLSRSVRVNSQMRSTGIRETLVTDRHIDRQTDR